jgi:antitoxin component of MazEF toxin-antitoxin module
MQIQISYTTNNGATLGFEETRRRYVTTLEDRARETIDKKLRQSAWRSYSRDERIQKDASAFELVTI